MWKGRARAAVLGSCVAMAALAGCSVGYTIEDAGRQMERGNVAAGVWDILMLPVVVVADVATFGSISLDMERRRQAHAAGPEALAAYNQESEARARAMEQAAFAAPQSAVAMRPAAAGAVGPRTAAAVAALNAAAAASSGGRTATDAQPVQGGQCAPGPRCNALEQRATPIVQGYASGLTPSVNNAAMMAFCTGTVTAEVLRNCAAEQHEMGRPDCARMVEAEMQSFTRMAQEAQSTSRQTTVGDWRQRCGWR